MTNLDAGAIKEVERLTRESEVIVVPSQEPNGVYYIRQPDGTLTRHRAELDARPSTVYDLESFGQAVNESTTVDEASGLFVHDSAVVLVNQNGTGSHRWTVTLPLPTHPAFEMISAWVKPVSITQKELVRLLRTQLSLYVDDTVISLFSTLRFHSSTDGSSSVKPASVALDRRIVQQVKADMGQDVPDAILFTPPVYDIREDRDEEYPVKVYVEYDHDTEKFMLCAVQGDVRKAREQATGKIIEHLRDRFADRLLVLYGKPS